jgi:ATP-dependent Clp protease ATP-binding subunit ClpX
VAREALRRKSGARGLRATLENIMLNVMYELPSRRNIRSCVVNEEVIFHGEDPILELESEVESA